MKTRYLVVLFAIAAIAVVEYAVLSKVNIQAAAGGSAGGPGAGTGASSSAPPRPYDVSKLVKPPKKYLGVAVEGGADLAKVKAFGDEVGKAPNLVAIFESFKDDFAASQVRNTYNSGAMTVIRWEPNDVPMKDIAAGKQDAYIQRFAKAVHTLNLPIGLTFAHEMNGDWYTWGTKTTSAADYVAAWRHVHDTFKAAGATNVIWTWTPNVVNYLRQVKLAPLYPGDDYVDWVGLDGYYTTKGLNSYSELFAPTIAEVRKFTQKQLLIVETGVEPGGGRPAEIDDLLSSVLKSPDLLGFMYFNLNGTNKWRLDGDNASLAKFAARAKDDAFGFDVRELK